MAAKRDVRRCLRREATRVASPVSTGGSPDIHGRERRQGREGRRHRRPAGCIEVVCTAGGTNEEDTNPPLLSVPGPTAAADS